MVDINIAVKGNADSAKQAMRDVGDAQTTLYKQATAQGDAQRKQSEEMWKSIGQWAAAAAAAVTAFGVASVKAFMEADRVGQQLKRAAGEYTAVLEEQASVMQELYAVDDDLIKQQQVLLAQWGGVGAASQETTTAILNYATAVGVDATTATEELIRNVESGGKQFERLGIHFDATGDKAEDLKRAVAALNEKFGGAAAADANSLHGNISALSNAFADFQEHIGGAIAKFNEQYAITYKLTEALKGLDTFLFGDAAEEKRQENLELHTALTDRLTHRRVLVGELRQAEEAGDTAAIARSKELLAETDKNIAKLKEMIATRNAAIAGGPLPAATGGATAIGARDAAQAAKEAARAEREALKEAQRQSLEDGKEFAKLQKEGDEAAAEASIEVEKKRLADLKTLLEEEKELRDEARKREKEAREGEDKMALESYKAQREAEKKHIEEMLKAEADAEKKAAEDAKERTKKQEKQWKEAADAIGAAFVNALADQLSKLAAGGEFDAALFVGDILAAAVGTAATVIGTAYGAPAVGGAIGNLAAMGIRAGASSISAQNKKAQVRYHDGGWPRAHSGAWMGVGPDEVPVITQTGERVLSRREVSNMGGPSGVDAAARGGARVAVYINAIDSKSAAQSFETDLGKGMRRAMRTGRGDVPALLGMGPR